MKAFFDSSAYSKRFYSEAGSDEVDNICANASELILSAIAIPEIISSLSRKKREGKILEKDYIQARSELYKEAKDAVLIRIDSLILDNTVNLLEKFPLRTLDAIHISSAIDSEVDLFVTSDKKQHEVALKLGLQVKYI